MCATTIDTLIIGGGLSGIYAACLLTRAGQSATLLEARPHVGGRIMSPRHQGYRTDLGPSWYWPSIHPTMGRLVKELGLTGYRQFNQGLSRFQHVDGTVRTIGAYPSQPTSWRLAGGMMALIASLSSHLPENAIRCSHPVCRIEKGSEGVWVHVGELEQPPRCRFLARRVILALPPRLAAATILFAPDLSPRLTQAMLRTGTWMAGQAKFCSLYDQPFWRQRGLSGQAFSECGPLGEIHDGSNHRNAPYGLTGFVGIPAVQRNQQQDMDSAMLAQLTSIFGQPAATPTAFFYQDWAREPYTATDFDQAPMRSHPDYGPPAGITALWDGRIHFAGTETASRHGGYLEGALNAAERAVAAM